MVSNPLWLVVGLGGALSRVSMVGAGFVLLTACANQIASAVPQKSLDKSLNSSVLAEKSANSLSRGLIERGALDLDGLSNFSSAWEKSRALKKTMKIPAEEKLKERFSQAALLLSAPEKSDGYKARASILFELSEYEAAAESFEEAALYSLNDKSLPLWQGLSLHLAGDDDAALWLAHVALMQDDKNADAHRLKAVCLSSRDFRRSLNEMERALALAPGNASFYASKARILIENKQYKEALVSAKKSLELDKSLLAGYIFAADALRRAGHLKEALGYLDQALVLCPYAPSTYRLRAQIYRAMGDDDAAAQDMALQSLCQDEIRRQAEVN